MPPMTFEFDSLGMTMEVSMAKIDGSILEDVLEVFPSAPRNQPLICILTLQAYKTQGALDDLSAMDVSLERYLAWEKAIREVIGPKYWCDSVDPKTYVMILKNVIFMLALSYVMIALQCNAEGKL